MTIYLKICGSGLLPVNNTREKINFQKVMFNQDIEAKYVVVWVNCLYFIKPCVLQRIGRTQKLHDRLLKKSGLRADTNYTREITKNPQK